jgi:hypothetical protein
MLRRMAYLLKGINAIDICCWGCLGEHKQVRCCACRPKALVGEEGGGSRIAEACVHYIYTKCWKLRGEFRCGMMRG